MCVQKFEIKMKGTFCSLHSSLSFRLFTWTTSYCQPTFVTSLLKLFSAALLKIIPPFPTYLCKRPLTSQTIRHIGPQGLRETMLFVRLHHESLSLASGWPGGSSSPEDPSEQKPNLILWMSKQAFILSFPPSVCFLLDSP